GLRQEARVSADSARARQDGRSAEDARRASGRTRAERPGADSARQIWLGRATLPDPSAYVALRRHDICRRRSDVPELPVSFWKGRARCRVTTVGTSGGSVRRSDQAARVQPGCIWRPAATRRYATGYVVLGSSNEAHSRLCDVLASLPRLYAAAAGKQRRPAAQRL